MHNHIYVVESSKQFTFCPYRTATVRCVQYDEAEDVNANFAGAFRRPPTVARFQTLIGEHRIIA